MKGWGAPHANTCEQASVYYKRREERRGEGRRRGGMGEGVRSGERWKEEEEGAGGNWG